VDAVGAVAAATVTIRRPSNGRPCPNAEGVCREGESARGNDPDLQFDLGIFCAAGGGASNQERASIGVPNSEPRLQPFPAPNPPAVLGGQRLFDNFYWIGNTGIGAWLITSNDGSSCSIR
jgi:hypothetical protein